MLLPEAFPNNSLCPPFAPAAYGKPLALSLTVIGIVVLGSAWNPATQVALSSPI